MVNFVLDADAQKAFRLAFAAAAAEVVVSVADFRRTLDVGKLSRQRQAAFLPVRRFFGGAEDFRVYQDEFGVGDGYFNGCVRGFGFVIFAAFRDVHDDDALVNVHLRCREANAMRFVHGLEHVVGYRLECVGELAYGFGGFAQAAVGMDEDVKQRHVWVRENFLPKNEFLV